MLHVENLTVGQVLVDKGQVANNSWTRLKGLIGVRQLVQGDGLLISPCKGVHCMFMSMPIDVLYVDQQDQVVGIDKEMQPWTVGRVHKASRYVIELPAGAVARTGTAVGDQLHVEGAVTQPLRHLSALLLLLLLGLLAALTMGWLT